MMINAKNAIFWNITKLFKLGRVPQYNLEYLNKLNYLTSFSVYYIIKVKRLAINNGRKKNSQ